jgi:prepilin peptidase CpaA
MRVHEARLRFGKGAGLAFLIMTTSWASFILCFLLAAALLRAAQTDWRSRTISNRLNLAIAGLAPLWWLAQGMAPWPDMALQFALGFIVFWAFALFFWLGAMGGGDVKLIAALALWLPLQPFLSMLLIMALAGGALTVVMLIIHKRSGQEGQPEVPYGIAISCGGLWVLGERYLNLLVQ